MSCTENLEFLSELGIPEGIDSNASSWTVLNIVGGSAGIDMECDGVDLNTSENLC